MPLIADLHRAALLEEVELERRARLARGAKPGTPTWRRILGRATAAAGRALDGAAHRIDPALRHPDGARLHLAS